MIDDNVTMTKVMLMMFLFRNYCDRTPGCVVKIPQDLSWEKVEERRKTNRPVRLNTQERRTQYNHPKVQNFQGPKRTDTKKTGKNKSNLTKWQKTRLGPSIFKNQKCNVSSFLSHLLTQHRTTLHSAKTHQVLFKKLEHMLLNIEMPYTKMWTWISAHIPVININYQKNPHVYTQPGKYSPPPNPPQPLSLPTLPSQLKPSAASFPCEQAQVTLPFPRYRHSSAQPPLLSAHLLLPAANNNKIKVHCKL